MTKSTITRDELNEVIATYGKHHIAHRMANVLLAAMDSEPVSQNEPISFDEWSRKCALQITLCYPDFREKAQYIWDSARETQQLAPAPVVSADLLHTAASAIEDLLTTKDRTGAGVWFDLPFRLRSAANAQPAPVVPELRVDWQENEFSAGWNACRAAMLQAGTLTNKGTKQAWTGIPDIDNAINMLDRIDTLESCDDDRIEAVKTVLRRLAGNSPAIPDGYVMVPMRLTAENGAKGALSGEFSETKFVNCPECFGDDECETCDGSGRIEITVPVTWTTIKEIWAKGVEHFSATPREVKGE